MQSGICKCHHHREGGLDGEVDGKESLLERRELRPRQATIGYNAVHERLENRGTKESAITAST